MAGLVAVALLVGVGILALRAGADGLRPFEYDAGKRADFERGAAAGESHLLYAKSPGGVRATAQRVAALHGPIAAAAAAGHVDAGLLEGLVFLESGGRPDAVAGSDPGAAAGVAQILPGTARTLLGMRVNADASRRLSDQISAARSSGQATLVRKLERRRRKVDERFDPRRALAATGRYLAYARSKFGTADFALASYHMGVGNLANAVRAFEGPNEHRLAVKVIEATGLSYAQLYFDSTPFRHRGAFRLLATLGDSSATYLWRVMAARDIMALYRRDPTELERVIGLQTAHGSGEALLHPPGRTEVFANSAALARARSRGALVAVPNQPKQRHFAVDPSLADRYKALRPEALGVLYYIADRMHAIAGKSQGPLHLTATVRDTNYEQALARSRHTAPPGYSLYTTGYSFDLARRYASPRQAQAMQVTLDRLQGLDVIAWERKGGVLHIVASDNSRSLLPLVRGRALAPDA